MSSAIDQLDLAWVLICSALIFLMQAGFCLLEAGLVRSKNSINVAIKNLMDFCVSSLLFWAIGFGLMFGHSYLGWIGLSHFVPDAPHGPKFLAFLLFQTVFCCTATTIVSGAVAERMRFGSYLVLCAVMSGVVYPLFGHWAWNNGAVPGWLKQLGFVDFAGSTVVHVMGAAFALATLTMIGPRIGGLDQERTPIRPHNLINATMGVFLLWFGWFGFNGGSELHPDGIAGQAILNTVLAGAAGGLAGTCAACWWYGVPRIEPILNGVLGGLVGVTAGCNVLAPWAAVVVGGTAGLVVFFSIRLLIRQGIDDAVGAVPVHGFAGAWGTMAVALFVSPAALGFGDRPWLVQVGVQALGVTVCGGFSFAVGWLACQSLGGRQGLRASAQDEHEGLNYSEHRATTELGELLRDMHRQQLTGDFSQPVTVDPHTEVGRVAERYNQVLVRVQEEIAAQASAAALATEAEHRYRDIFENAIEGIFQTSPEGQYLTANPALARLYGYDSVEQMLGTVSDIQRQIYVRPERRQEFIAVLERDGQLSGFESEVYRRDGSVIWISETAHPVCDAAGQLLYYEGTVEDITRRKENEQLVLEKQRADAASAAKSDFLARMSHEIRTPLNGVIGMLELLEGTSLSPQQSQYMRICHSSAQALLAVINDVLDLSRIEAGKLSLERLEFDLQELVDDIVEMFGHRAESRGLELLGQMQTDVPHLVIADPERIRQVLINLVNNAIKFTDRGAVRVEVHCVERDAATARLRFDVIDTGPGIPAEKQQLLFAAFSQLETSVARTHGGSGLGLAICKQLVDLMEGSLNVASQPGSGSTFSFTIPCGVSNHSDGEPTICLQNTRILVVDDHEDNRQIIRDHLRWMGCDPELVPDAETAWERLTAVDMGPRSFDLILLDQNLPGMDGLTLAARIQSIWGTTAPPIVMLVSWDRAQSPADLESRGVVASISKPVRRSRLLDAVLAGLKSRIMDSPVTRPLLVDAPPAPAPPARILVLEDHEINQIVIEELLNSLGFSVRVCANGVEGLHATTEETFSAILADCQMPQLDGLEFARSFRRWEDAHLRPRTPIVALTASAVVGERERCLAAGMNDFLSKPVHRKSLLEVLQRAIQTPIRTFQGPFTDRSAEPPVDLEMLCERSGGASEFQHRILKKFAIRATDDVRDLEIACVGENWRRAGNIAHGLRGAAATIAAHEIALVATEIEDLSKSDSPQQLEDRIPTLRTAVQRFQDWWEQLPIPADGSAGHELENLLVGKP